VDPPGGVWLNDECQEITLRSHKYDQSISILHFGTRYIEFEILGRSSRRDIFDRRLSAARCRSRQESSLRLTLV
jgi:hypothetical protein